MIMLVDCNANMDNENSFNLNSLSCKTQIKISNSLCRVIEVVWGTPLAVNETSEIWKLFGIHLDWISEPATTPPQPLV